MAILFESNSLTTLHLALSEFGWMLSVAANLG